MEPVKRTRTSKKMDFEIRFCEELLKDRPDFMAALDCLGAAYTREGLYSEGLAMDQKMVTLKPHDPYVWYNLACSYSLTGDVDKALDALKKAVLFGYDDFKYLAKDKDLKALRATDACCMFLKKVAALHERRDNPFRAKDEAA